MFGSKRTPLDDVRVASPCSKDWAEMVGTELPERLPQPYLDEAADRFGATLDPDMADEVVALRSEHRSRVEAELGRTIEVARSNLFPRHGLTA